MNTILLRDATMLNKKVIFPIVLAIGIGYCYSWLRLQDGESIDDKKAEKIRVNINNFVKPLPCDDCRGKNGEPVILTEDEKKLVPAVMSKYFCNTIASDFVSLWRTLPDVRFDECKLITYPDDLPTVSFIIVFKNEPWSPLLRTVYSVINESPRHLIKEILLIDDYSENDELKDPLDKYCDEHFGAIVRIIRTPKHFGLIVAKIFGAKHATGDVLVYLDGHCECTSGWLEPLLAPIKENRKTIMVPQIPVIDANNLKYHGSGLKNQMGAFTLGLQFTWRRLPQRVLNLQKSVADPFPSPTMAGGLFAIDRNYFFEVGSYDEEMEVWGGENLEMSFRIWTCGGEIKISPCSFVGHIYRAGHPYNQTGEKSKNNPMGYNSARVAEVWLDEYKRLFYTYSPEMRSKNFGNISNRVELRKNLNCKSFKWYIDNVYPELYIQDEQPAFGELGNHDFTYCFDTYGVDEKKSLNVALYNCYQNESSNQFFSYNGHEIRRDKIASICLEAKSEDGAYIFMLKCNDNEQQKWKHTRENGQTIHLKSGLCIEMTNSLSKNKNIHYPRLSQCDSNKKEQIWQFRHYM